MGSDTGYGNSLPEIDDGHALHAGSPFSSNSSPATNHESETYSDSTLLNSPTPEINDYDADNSETDRWDEEVIKWPQNSGDRDSERLDFQNELFHELLEGDHLWQITQCKKGGPAMVLDVGTGTGKWAIDYDTADANPDRVMVYGTDLRPIQPDM
ncbi:uncharacterized protein ColSpa_12804 [Colletotrichum spaethianum]|uniref:Methyltransferase domain-containing protein n=1 Tax=Colletotrichum spaethianum TaxID=700344 RepID=A0AA37UTV5_9PEZI|nr:uncharacterized protein ColSpa_12804 [Colletotrichum spaethianum]GKT52623.1 hypothetical protein ColSpa_12804 [Colletotrichum spaethianum]